MRHSHSSLNQFSTCPWQYYRQRIAKDLPEQPPHPAAAKGTRAHRLLEDAFKANNTPPGYEDVIRVVKHHADRIPDAVVLTEQKLSLDGDLVACENDVDGESFVSIIDVLIVSANSPYAFILDYKTGKLKLDTTQLGRYALVVFAHYPHVDYIMAANLWLKVGKIHHKYYRRDTDLAGLRFRLQLNINTVDTAAQAGSWPCKPSGLCAGFCPVTDCAYWKPMRRR